MIFQKISEFLQTNIYESNYILIEYWTIVHLISGMIVFLVLYKILSKRTTSERFFVLFLLLWAWEIFELIVGFGSAEQNTDRIWDLFAGMLGGAVVYLIRSRFSNNRNNIPS